MALLSTEIMVRQCMDLVKAGLLPFVEQEMYAVYGMGWESRAGCQMVTGKPHWDLQALLRTLLDNWQAVFDKSLPRTAKNLVFELKDWRNQVAHEHKMTLDDTSRMIDTATRLLKIVGAPQTPDVEQLRLQTLQAVIADAGHAPDTASENTAPEKPRDSQTVSSSTASSSKVLHSPERQSHVSGAPSWQACITRLGKHFGADLTQKSGRCAFSADYSHGVCCLVSKEHAAGRFWWNLRDRQIRDLTAAHAAFLAFGCGSSDAIVSIPLKDFTTWLPTFNPKSGVDGEGWHIHILHDAGKWWLLQMGRDNRIDITRYLV